MTNREAKNYRRLERALQRGIYGQLKGELGTKEHLVKSIAYVTNQITEHAEKLGWLETEDESYDQPLQYGKNFTSVIVDEVISVRISQPAVYADDPTECDETCDIYWNDGVPLFKRAFKPGEEYRVTAKCFQSLRTAIVGPVFVSTSSECTCDSLLNGHLPECPYPKEIK